MSENKVFSESCFFLKLLSMGVKFQTKNLKLLENELSKSHKVILRVRVVAQNLIPILKNVGTI